MSHLVPLIALALLLLLFGGGCTSAPKGQSVLVPAVPFVTKDTGQLTIERQQFINTYAAAQVLFDAWLTHERDMCARPACADAARCARLPEIATEGKGIKMTINAKLKNPEAELDWGHIVSLLGLIAKVVL